MNKLQNIERKILLGIGAVLVVLFCLFIYQFIFNPVESEQRQLQEKLDSIKPVEVAYEKPHWDFERWEQSFAARPGMWKALIATPPPPPKAPAPPPNLAKLLADVSASRRQVGAKVNILQKGDKRGTFMAVGDELTVQGIKCVVKEITKTEVVFAHTHLGKEITYSMPRN